MSIINYFKEITVSWKLALFAVIFCIWPVSSFLIFHYEPAIFVQLDLLKLTLLASAIASPFMLINALACVLLCFPKDEELVGNQSPDQKMARSVLGGVGTTLWVLSMGAMAAMLNVSITYVKMMIIVMEIALFLVIIFSKVAEDRRYAKKLLKQRPQEPV